MPSLLETAQRALWAARRKPLEAFLAPVAALGDRIVCRDGSLATLVEISGSRSMIGAPELEAFAETVGRRLNAPLARRGHALHVVFERSGGARPVSAICERGRAQAAALGLDLDDLFREREARLAPACALETVVAAAWTRPSVLAPAEIARGRRTARARLRDWLPAPADSQCPLAVHDALSPRHAAWTDGVADALAAAGVDVRPMTGEEAVRTLRTMISGAASTPPDWRPVTAANDAPPRVTEPLEDGGFPPPLAPQILVREPDCTAATVRVDDRVYAPLDMILGPRAARPFDELVAAAARAGIPLRASFLIEGGGLAGMDAAAARVASAFLAFSSEDSIRVRDSMRDLADAAAESRAVVRLRVGFLTWAGPADGEDALAHRLGRLQRAVEAWGEAVCTPVVGDPLETLASSVPGFACAATAPAARAPLAEALRLLPVGRPAAMARGAADHVFRSPDGRLLPWSSASGGDHGLDLVYGVPGRGKSVLLASLALAHVLQSGQAELPRLAIVDVGASSSGLVSLIRDALPASRRDEAGWFPLRMDDACAINPMDTPLGCRRPIPSSRAFLEGMLQIVLTPPGRTGVPDGLREIAGPAIDAAYEMRSDDRAGSEPRRYAPGRDPAVDRALEERDCRVAPDAVWWEVVDALFEAGAPGDAARAQRHAVPVLPDLVSAARSDAVQGLVRTAGYGAAGETATEAFARVLTAAAGEWPIMFRSTTFDVSAARVAGVDLREVAPRGSAAEDRQTAAMYLLARHALTRDWWMAAEDVDLAPGRYRAWHRSRHRRIAEAPKRLAYDEYHRTAASPAVRVQVERDAREARKQRVTLCLASQRLEDFGESLVELANRYWILGAGGLDRELAVMSGVFGLGDTLRDAVRHELTGPGRDGAPALLIGTGERGRREQVVVNAPGAVELWALTTAPRDVSLRDRVSGRLPPPLARAALARAFPAGSAAARIEAETADLEARSLRADENSVLDRIADEVVALGAAPPPQAADGRAT